jgi:hypothetical protein
VSEGRQKVATNSFALHLGRPFGRQQILLSKLKVLFDQLRSLFDLTPFDGRVDSSVLPDRVAETARRTGHDLENNSMDLGPLLPHTIHDGLISKNLAH